MKLGLSTRWWVGWWVAFFIAWVERDSPGRPVEAPFPPTGSITESDLAVPSGVAEQFAITEATLSAWSSLDDEELQPEDSTQGAFQLQGTAGDTEAGWAEERRGWCLGLSGGLLLSPPRSSMA